MAWEEKGESLLPVVYHIELENYDLLPQLSEREIKSETDDIINYLGEIWGDLRGWWLSGAVAVSAVTHTYSRPHTNTDIIVFDDKTLLEKMAERAKPNMFLFSRDRSYKKWFRSTTKHERYYLASPMAVASNKSSDKNYMFRAVDQNGCLVPINRISTVIRLYPCKIDERDDTYFSIEDGRKIPAEFLKYDHKKGRMLFQSGNKQVFAVNLEHMLSVLRTIPKKKQRNKQKHLDDTETIKKFMRQNPDYLITKAQA